MKTLNILFTLTALLTATATATAAPSEIGQSISVRVSHGDANGDGRLDMYDVRTMLGILFGGTRQTVSDRDLDFNEDGRFDIADADALGREIAEIDSGSRPCGTCAERAVLGDANDDGTVDIADLVVLGRYYSDGTHPQAPDEALDLNQDGRFDIADLVVLAEALG